MPPNDQKQEKPYDEESETPKSTFVVSDEGLTPGTTISSYGPIKTTVTYDGELHTTFDIGGGFATDLGEI